MISQERVEMKRDRLQERRNALLEELSRVKNMSTPEMYSKLSHIKNTVEKLEIVKAQLQIIEEVL